MSSKTYQDLESQDPASYNKLNDSVLRAFVIKQLNPKDNTSIHHIFERLNTGGTLLRGQEIRNCVFHGEFNDLLFELNKNKLWREIYGSAFPDKRQRDIELILRFLALSEKQDEYERPMKDFLSNFMARYRSADAKVLEHFKQRFEQTTELVHQALGEKPFHIRRGLNAAVFDSVFTAFAKGNETHPDIKSRYLSLLKNPAFAKLIGSSTTDNETVQARIQMADSLFDRSSGN